MPNATRTKSALERSAWLNSPRGVGAALAVALTMRAQSDTLFLHASCVIIDGADAGRDATEDHAAALPPEYQAQQADPAAHEAQRGVVLHRNERRQDLDQRPVARVPADDHNRAEQCREYGCCGGDVAKGRGQCLAHVRKLGPKKKPSEPRCLAYSEGWSVYRAAGREAAC